jgi:hypothetical protein
MKAITVKQPWASIIAEGIKDIENRTWKTNFRGRVLIHAAAKPVKDGMGALSVSQITASDEWFKNSELMPILGAIIGSVEIVECVINHPSIWSEKTNILTLGDVFDDLKLLGMAIPPKTIYNWVLANPIKFKNPIPAKGKLSFWESQCEILECPNCGEYCLHDNHDIMIRNWGNPVHICEHCSYAILESEFEFLK